MRPQVLSSQTNQGHTVQKYLLCQALVALRGACHAQLRVQPGTKARVELVIFRRNSKTKADSMLSLAFAEEPTCSFHVPELQLVLAMVSKFASVLLGGNYFFRPSALSAPFHR